MVGGERKEKTGDVDEQKGESEYLVWVQPDEEE